jgi:hypothetical protein
MWSAFRVWIAFSDFKVALDVTLDTWLVSIGLTMGFSEDFLK